VSKTAIVLSIKKVFSFVAPSGEQELTQSYKVNIISLLHCM